jgi:hypothetical protein
MVLERSPKSNVNGVAAMLSWMQRSPSAISAVCGPYHLLRPFPDWLPLRRSNARDTLPGDFPDYFVFVTRHSLLAFTTSLENVSTEVHTFFTQLSYCLALDRMMRTFMAWGMPGVAPSAPFAMMQPWLTAATRSPNLSYFTAPQLLPPARSMAPRPINVRPQDAGETIGAVYTAMMAFSAACFHAAPAAMDAWGASAAS